MEVFIQLLQFILIISILVILHELGHFIPARLFKTRVEKFFLFFDVKFALFKKKIGETVYGIGWLPLGGYVKISGMVDESMDKEQLKQPPQPWEFRSKPVWQRLIIMVGGVTVNFLLAWGIYTILLFSQGETYIPSENLKYGIYVDSVGEQLGFKNGDRIVSVDGKRIKSLTEASLEVLLGDEVTVRRDGVIHSFPLREEAKKAVLESQGRAFLSPRSPAVIDTLVAGYAAAASGLQKGDRVVAVNGNVVVYWDEFVSGVKKYRNDSLKLGVKRGEEWVDINLKVPDSGVIGVSNLQKELFVTKRYGLGSSVSHGLAKTIGVLTGQVKSFKLVFSSKAEGYKHVKGPIGIVGQMPTEWNWVFFWGFTAMFSVWLAFINILPIPALDGGHVMFLFYEMVTGKKPSDRALEVGQIVGFVIIMGLMALVFGNDIWNLIKHAF